MSFFKSLKSAFGFGPDSGDSDDTLLADESFAAINAPGAAEAAVAEPEPAPDAPVLDPHAVRGIFSTVVDVFNASLPAFVGATIDKKAQEDYLYSQLEQSLKDYLTRLIDDARVYAEGSVRHENHETLAELGRLRREKESLEQQRSSIKEQQLSADRQRRALTDRVRDLEQQLASLEAEREQFDLENKSLLNKIKLSEIRPAVVEELNAEIASLRAQLSARKDTTTAPGDDSDAAEHLRQAQARIAELEQTLAGRDEAQRTASEMFSSLQHELVEERRKHTEALSEKDSLLAEKDAQLEEAAQLLKGMENLSDQMQQVEVAINKRDERIKSLQLKNRDLRKLLEKAEKRLAGSITPSLPFDNGSDTIADPAQKYGSADADMISTSPIRPEDLDESFREVDWLTGTPPKGTVIRSELTDDEFGYQEPQRKPKPKDHDSQLSLF